MYPKNLDPKTADCLREKIIETAAIEIEATKQIEETLLNQIPELMELLQTHALLKKAQQVRVLFSSFYIELPLDKKLMRQWIQYVNTAAHTDEIGWRWRFGKEPEVGECLFSLQYNDLKITLDFSERATGSTCKRIRIGTSEKTYTESIFEIVCDKGAGK